MNSYRNLAEVNEYTNYKAFQGTSKPSHYIILYDSWHLSADDWQVSISSSKFRC